MIDVFGETLLALHDAAKVIPGRKGRRGIHKSALYRWVQKGVGGVRLEAIPIGGTLYTSQEAIQRFCEARAASREAPTERPVTEAVLAAEKELDRLGF